MSPLPPRLEALLVRVEACFRERFGGAPEVLAWAPGRVNLIGEHTDYTGGLAMPAAIDRWVVTALRQGGSDARIWSEDYQDDLALPLGAPPPERGWRAYVGGAVALTREAGLSLGRPLRRAPEGVVLGDVPLGAGLSSSAAIECALLGGLRRLYDLPLDDLALVRRAVEIEHRFLHLQSGLLDQMASQLSRAGSVLLIDFRALSWRLLPADFGPWRWLVADSGTRRELAGSAYSERVAACRAGLEALRRAGVATHLRDVSPDDLERVGAGQPWLPRLRHVVRENARVLEMAEALARGDLTEAGRLLQRSHQSLSGDYAVSTPELDHLAETSWALPGCAGGRMMGGGFGGCTIHLVHEEHVEGFEEGLSAAFEARFGRPAPVLRLTLVDGAGGR